MTWDNQNRDSDKGDKIYSHSEAQSFFYVLFGAALCAGGLYLAGHFFNEIKPFIIAAFFIVILPVPMVWFGVQIIINALTFKITLLPDKLTIEDGTSETEVGRSQIEAYRVTKDQIELKTESSIIRKSIPKKFDSDPEFAAWFDGVRQVPEYKPSSGLEKYNYPLLYRPRLFYLFISLKEHRKRNASGALCDDPRIAVGPGVLTELQRERKRSQHARQSDTASSHLGSRDARRTGGELCIVANRGRIRAAEGIGGRVKFLPLAWAGMPKTSFRKNSDSLLAICILHLKYFNTFQIILETI